MKTLNSSSIFKLSLYLVLTASFSFACQDVKSDVSISIKQEGVGVVAELSGSLKNLGEPPGWASTVTVSQIETEKSKVNFVFSRGMLTTENWNLSLLNDSTGTAGHWGGDFFAHADSSHLIEGNIDAFMFVGVPTDNAFRIEGPFITLAGYSWGSEFSGKITFADTAISDLGFTSFGTIEYEIMPEEGGVSGQKITITLVEP